MTLPPASVFPGKGDFILNETIAASERSIEEARRQFNEFKTKQWAAMAGTIGAWQELKGRAVEPHGQRIATPLVFVRESVIRRRSGDHV